MEITPNQKEKINQLAQKYHLKMILLFGSQVSGKLNQESDIDIAFLSKKNLSFKQEYFLNYELTNIFQNHQIDTTNLRKAPPLLMKEILNNSQILYQSAPMIFDAFEVYALQRYQEALPLFVMHQQAIKNFIHDKF